MLEHVIVSPFIFDSLDLEWCPKRLRHRQFLEVTTSKWLRDIPYRTCWYHKSFWCHWRAALYWLSRHATTMKITAVLAFLSSSAAAFTAVAPRIQRAAFLSMSSAVEAGPFAKPEKIVLNELPSLFVYDHCPFCVRVRLALGLKNIKFNLQFLANDDVATPTALVGKKIAPIFVSTLFLWVASCQRNIIDDE